ncbi:MAG: HNH endonuclease [Pseudomonadota bacterium]|nr:HNH endonuclease [Pseudomonadota bacterium]
MPWTTGEAREDIFNVDIERLTVVPGVFTWNPGSRYGDHLEREYVFPKDYAGVMSDIGKGWMVFHRSKRSGLPPAYIGVGEVHVIEPFEGDPSMTVARIRNYLAFDPPVPFSEGKGSERRYRETYLRGVDSKLIGHKLQKRSVRALPEEDFASIVADGLSDIFDEGNTALLDLDDPDLRRDGADLLRLPREEQVRRIQEILLKRPIRDAAFRKDVRQAYDFRCAITGLQIRNGGGRPEVDGAHIWAVEDGGPDVVQNGIAMSKTAHWMFDRGLIVVRDDYSLYVSHNKVPPEMRALIGERERRIGLPADAALHPDPYYLAKHREKHMAGSL